MKGDRAALVVEARTRLITALDDEVGDRLVHPGGKVDMYADGCVVRPWDLLDRCPARVAHPVDDFEESARNVARRLGRLTLRRWSPPQPMGEAVDDLLSDREDWPRGLREWFVGLDRAGVAPLRASTTSWAVGAARAVRGRPTRWVDRTMNVDVPGRMIRLAAGWDAQDAGRPTALLVMSDAVSSNRSRLIAGFSALACALLTQTAPERVVVASAASGRSTRVVVDDGLLSLTVDRVVDVVTHRVEPELAPTQPGRWCDDCHLLNSCEDGLAALGEG
ncbi:MAG: hypothetical protein ACHQDC_09675 [Acidimicrobiales bacterium]